jgi:hypothetical protein
MSKIVLASTTGLICLFLANGANAALCGDDVDGKDVPCACGDTVVSDLVLGDDPVTTAVCPSDALLVRANEGAKGLTIDLRGKTLRGQGQGVGIWFLSGGEGGARLVSTGAPGAIVGFQDGVAAHGDDTLALVENVSIRDNGRDGVRVFTSSFAIRRAEVVGSGRDGFSLSGRGYQVSDTQASRNGRFGYFLRGENGVIGRSESGASAERNGDAGFNVLGNGFELTALSASGNGKDGVMARGSGLGVRGCRTESNRRNGLAGMGNNWTLAGNTAVGNEGNGILVRGNGLIDGGDNRGTDNRGEGNPQPAVQCQIGTADCAP